MKAREPRRILLVGSGPCQDLQKQFVRAEYDVVKTSTGTAAVASAKHRSFSAAVLLSTGGEMDFAETALNLRDVQPSLEIVILMDRTPDTQMTAQIAAVLRAIPNTKILTANELNAYLTSSQSG